ncbi:MAG: InlB B-repeat-containing protein [Bacteroidales bacterium]|nr:InlB B-repeat-containing protein [Bacteroidales bacterium]
MATTIQKYIYALFSIIVLLCSCDPLLVPQSVTQAYEEDANGHKYVDLGLSVKWAAYDIGAKSAAEHGSFFAWGETQPKDKYSWENYKYAAPRKEHDGDTRAFDDEYEMTKYNIDEGSDYYDGKTTLELMDDAAHMAWGGNWRMPTADECEELLEKCEWTWTEYLGMGGYDVKGPNGNRIFLPELEIGQPTPQLINTSLNRWSSSVRTGKNAYRLDGDGGYNVHSRCEGLFVRAVWGKTLPKFFILSFDANGGEGLMHPQQFNKGVSQSINSVVRFTHESLNFVGWNTAPDGSGQWYANGEEITLSKDLTLYAQWALATGSENGYDYIDLGLPSGLKWATCNVGATSPEGYGDYFAWGEIAPKDEYSWATYKYCNGSETSLTKYNTSSDYGTVDNKTILEHIDDAARANWGGKWRIPTEAEQDELRNNCTWTWTTRNGINGYKVTSKTNGNSIFLPAAGYRYGTSVYNVGSYGHYWSSSLYESNPSYACCLSFYSDVVGWSYSYRYFGRTVRAVFSENDTPSTFVTLSFDANGGSGTMAAQLFEAGVTQTLAPNKFARSAYYFSGWNTNADGSGTSYTDKQSITISQDITLYAQWALATGSENGHEWVDLGLSSGLKWATCNVGATAPEGYGDYFAWGETNPKDNYNWSTYKYCKGSYDTMTKYCTQSSYGTVDNKTTLELSDDAARANWGGAWRMPTEAEQDELRNNCTWTWTTQNGVNGYKVISKTNGNSIFLPAAGDRSGTSVRNVGSNGYYWSSSLVESDPYIACYLIFYSGYVCWSNSSRYYGHPVRAVCP